VNVTRVATGAGEVIDGVKETDIAEAIDTDDKMAKRIGVCRKVRCTCWIEPCGREGSSAL
jgi:hypothetical protein